MKIGIIGSVGAGLRLLLETRLGQDVEIVEVTQKQVDEDKELYAVFQSEKEEKKAVVMCGHMMANIGKDVFSQPVQERDFSDKCTGRKSDRKRNRKNRWS